VLPDAVLFFIRFFAKHRYDCSKLYNVAAHEFCYARTDQYNEKRRTSIEGGWFYYAYVFLPGVQKERRNDAQ
ncbi:MAG: hypothetical protein Q4D04_12710, partial [Clostridia bacterium]|nr:hypothetical protein [Clostridia bacterium]